MKKKLLIIGASGHGKVVADIALKMDLWEEIAFLDDNKGLRSSMGLEVIGTSMDFTQFIENYDLFIGIGNNTIRKKLQKKLENNGVNLPVLIHPSAIIGEQVEMADGTVIMAGVIINSCTKIGRGCIINTASTIDHDNIIEDYVHISPGVHLAGNVRVGEETWLGIGSLVKNSISVTNKCQVGAGAVIVRDINESGTYIGIPARKIN
ncbi:acetyltransferase [Bacillus thuringiensis]|uniref:acetyltransferase n=1 Tax=Bacillus TaxID=1386 RepID=UPI000BEE47D3|nr:MULTISPECIES: acetyltransferase [Bacillus]MCP1321305.1 acetyltransferase [Bacillus sp. S0628]PEF31412.1 acetyltransferase [Bacillus thuringiensis]PET84740.1 acetyltransferase [Bacillus thuringiensis]PEV00339.1 acetyltransferase [Bacillus sp. AFS012607]PEY53559.1 acetyltransferase [Bacillus thuringiensis]